MPSATSVPARIAMLWHHNVSKDAQIPTLGPALCLTLRCGRFVEAVMAKTSGAPFARTLKISTGTAMSSGKAANEANSAKTFARSAPSQLHRSSAESGGAGKGTVNACVNP